jgi:shikimate dehydrogenase
MRKFGLIGYPLGHSFSKKYFLQKFANENITDCSYELFPIDSIKKLGSLLDSEAELCGLNVTIPYKSEIFGFLDYIDPEAAEIGAVNVVKISQAIEKRFLKGYNSDVYGIRETLLPYLKAIQSAIVLGTGGSSKAVCHVLEKAGIEVFKVSRSRRQGILDYSDLSAHLVERSGMVINTTPLGMYPDVESKPGINYNLLKSRHILFDLVYNPERTAFLKEGKDRGCTILGGLTMLHSQAERSWQIWNDPDL